MTIIAASLAMLGGLLAIPASAAVQDEDTGPVRDLTVSAVMNDQGNRYVNITWNEPDVSGYFSSVRKYRVVYSHDFRPQNTYVLTTTLREASLDRLLLGRTYTVIVQADTGDGWGREASVSFRVGDQANAPWIISLGDSFISGEGGRWAGNVSVPRNSTDVSPRAYFDLIDGERVPTCHRSAAALVHIGVARSMNFACSGAITTTTVDPGGRNFKPGIDFYRDNTYQVRLPNGEQAVGQAQMLQDFARGKNVKAVVLSIGGNNFNFSGIVTDCVTEYINPINGEPCSQDAGLLAGLSAASQEQRVDEMADAMRRVMGAMTGAGFNRGDWTLVYHMYPKPIASGADMRYPETLRRQTTGGCGFLDVDADWARDEVVSVINSAVIRAAREVKQEFPDMRIVLMDTTEAFRGHELCNKNVYRVKTNTSEDRDGVQSWRNAKAADRSEWVKEIELAPTGDATLNEGFHPNYWGQLALRNCMRQMWNKGTISSGGRCTPLSGTNRYREPNMQFTRDSSLTLL
jgi:hypothetical protein